MRRIEPVYESTGSKLLDDSNSNDATTVSESVPEEKQSIPGATCPQDAEKNADEYLIPDQITELKQKGRPPRYVFTKPILPAVPYQPQDENFFCPPPPPRPNKYGSMDQVPILEGCQSSYNDENDNREKSDWKTWHKVAILIGLFLIMAYSTASFVIVIVRGSPTKTAIETTRCASTGGVCMSILAERCDGGVFLPNYCTKSSTIVQCCLKSTRCSERGGQCLVRNGRSCGYGYRFEKGLCPGGNDILCCVKTSICTLNGGNCYDSRDRRCNGGLYQRGTCPGKSFIQCCYESKRCSSGLGKCQDQKTHNCTGRFESNLCPGRSSVRCCIPKQKK